MSASGNPLAAAFVRMEAENKRWKEWHSGSIDDYRELRLLRAENERLTLKLLFIEEWFDNILPADWEKCMQRWAERGGT